MYNSDPQNFPTGETARQLYILVKISTNKFTPSRDVTSHFYCLGRGQSPQSRLDGPETRARIIDPIESLTTTQLSLFPPDLKRVPTQVKRENAHNISHTNIPVIKYLKVTWYAENRREFFN